MLVSFYIYRRKRKGKKKKFCSLLDIFLQVTIIESVKAMTPVEKERKEEEPMENEKKEKKLEDLVAVYNLLKQHVPDAVLLDFFFSERDDTFVILYRVGNDYVIQHSHNNSLYCGYYYKNSWTARSDFEDMRERR